MNTEQPPSHRVDDDIRRMPVDPDVEVTAPVRLGALVRRDGDLLAVIAAGGALGSVARWALTEALPGGGAGGAGGGAGAVGFAWGTFTANVVGSLLLGVVMALVLDVWSHHRYARPFLGVGLCGGFTTFSTYQLDAHRLLADGAAPLAAGYLGATLAAGLLAVLVGVAGTRALVDRRGTAVPR